MNWQRTLAASVLGLIFCSDGFGAGLLDHLWPQDCCSRYCYPSYIPRCGCPDDYCPKIMPDICCRPYPPYYICGLPPEAYPPSCVRFVTKHGLFLPPLAPCCGAIPH